MLLLSTINHVLQILRKVECAVNKREERVAFGDGNHVVSIYLAFADLTMLWFFKSFQQSQRFLTGSNFSWDTDLTCKLSCNSQLIKTTILWTKSLLVFSWLVLQQWTNCSERKKKITSIEIPSNHQRRWALAKDTACKTWSYYWGWHKILDLSRELNSL